MAPTKDDIRAFLLSVLSKSEFKDSKSKKAVLSQEEQIQLESNKQNLKAIKEFVNSDWLHHKFIYQLSDFKRKPRRLRNKLFDPKEDEDEDFIPNQIEAISENSKYVSIAFLTLIALLGHQFSRFLKMINSRKLIENSRKEQ